MDLGGWFGGLRGRRVRSDSKPEGSSGGGRAPANPAPLWNESALAIGLPGLAVFLAVTLSGSGKNFEVQPTPLRLAVVAAWPVAAYLLARTGRIWTVAAFIVAAGAILRWNSFWPGGSSDVLNAVEEAIRTVLSGGNPYDHYYITTRPAGGAMPYPPGQLLLHLPGWLLGGYQGVRLTEYAAAIAAMAAIAWLALRFAPTVGLVGLALYAGLPNLIELTGDGSNDTSAGAVVLFAILAVAWAARRGFAGRSAVVAGVAVACALATKQSALMIGVTLTFYVFAAHRRAIRRYAAGLAVALLVFAIPFLLMGPYAFIHGIATIPPHPRVFGWNIWVMLQGWGWPAPDPLIASLVNFFIAADVLLATATLCARGVGSATLAGVLVTVATLMTATWTSHAYFALVLAPLAAVPALMAWDGARGRGSDVSPDAEPGPTEGSDSDEPASEAARNPA